MLRISPLQKIILAILLCICFNYVNTYAQSSGKTEADIFSQDPVIKDGIYPGIRNVKIKSGSSILPVLEYFPTGKGPHPTLILLHGYTGMPGNVDIALAMSRAGWNVVFFRYRGIWGMPGEFGFRNCVEDAVAVASYFHDSAQKMNVDTSRIMIFGHSMGGWVALKAATKLSFVKKVFALSTWDIYADAIEAKQKGRLQNWYKEAEAYVELKIKSGRHLYEPVFTNSSDFDLLTDLEKLKQKRFYFLDEHDGNKALVEHLRPKAESVAYEVWKSDHSFTYTRIAMLRVLLKFINE